MNMAEANTERVSDPQLVLRSQSDIHKVGDRIKLSLINIPSGEGLPDCKILWTPQGLEIVESEPLDDEKTKHFILRPTKYGAYKVTVGSLPKCAPVFIHVRPLAQLKLRVTGTPGFELPRDVIIDDRGFIVSDGVRKQITRISRGGSQETFETPKNVSNAFSPIGLALKQDLTSEDNNEVFVTDLNNACVHVYHGLRYLESFGAGVLKRPTGIAIDDDGFIFVGDYEEQKIFQFNPDYEPVEDEVSYSLQGPELMTIQKPVTSSGAGTANSLLVADRRGNKISIFTIAKNSEENGKTLNWVHNVEIGSCPSRVLPFSVACDENNHIFIAGQEVDEAGEKRGFIWFRDCNSLHFGESHKMEDWCFGEGMRNPGGMRIVSGDDGNSFLYVTDMRGRNAKSCINKFLLK